MTDTAKPSTERAPGPAPTVALTHAIHLGNNELPAIDLGDGSTLQLLQVDLNAGLWIVRTQFKPGYRVTKHYHTGPVYAVTYSGSWYYLEYPDDVNTAGSYLYEPAHSVHTLAVSDDNTEMTDVWFAIHGANVNMNDNGDVIGITDAQSILATYRTACAEQGLDCSGLIVNGEQV